MGMSGDTALALAKSYVKKTLQGQGALKGKDGFSPTVKENPNNTDKDYRLDITDKNGTITTPNLKGADSVGSADMALSDAKEYTDNKIADLVGGAPETLDTLKEIADALETEKGTVDALQEAIGTKLNKDGDSKDNTVTFVQSETRENIDSGDKHSVLFGKIRKWLFDLKEVAFSGSYTDLSNKPSAEDIGALPKDGNATSATKATNDGDGNNIAETYATKTKVDGVESQITTNLLKPTLGTTTQYGVTCTNNGDGTYTLNGTATGLYATFVLGTVDLRKGIKYAFCGCPEGGSTTKYRCSIWDNAECYGDTVIFESNENVKKNFSIRIEEGITVSDIVFKPMLTTNLNADYSMFVPYTGSTGQLNSDVASINNDLGGLSFSVSDGTLSITDGVNTWTLPQTT